MLRLKLAVIGLFVVLFLTFISTRLFMPAVQGRSGLAAPTGVIASDGAYKDKVGLNWNAVRGATLYRIFRNTVNDPVTAVGDPFQSIYGWRGASAGNVGRFTGQFPSSDDEPAAVYPLSTSWRNDRQILRVANLIAAPLDGARHADIERNDVHGSPHSILPLAE